MTLLGGRDMEPTRCWGGVCDNRLVKPGPNTSKDRRAQEVEGKRSLEVSVACEDEDGAEPPRLHRCRWPRPGQRDAGGGDAASGFALNGCSCTSPGKTAISAITAPNRGGGARAQRPAGGRRGDSQELQVAEGPQARGDDGRWWEPPSPRGGTPAGSAGGTATCHRPPCGTGNPPPANVPPVSPRDGVSGRPLMPAASGMA